MIKKIALTIILVILAVAVGAVIWMAVANPGMEGDATPTEMNQNNASNSPQTTTDGPQTKATIYIKNSAYAPHTITIKKGGTVTWINDDTIRHNVVAANQGESGGLPADNDLFGKGGSYTFTFNQVGDFDYLCAPHPFMTGRVKVVD